MRSYFPQFAVSQQSEVRLVRSPQYNDPILEQGNRIAIECDPQLRGCRHLETFHEVAAYAR